MPSRPAGLLAVTQETAAVQAGEVGAVAGAVAGEGAETGLDLKV